MAEPSDFLVISRGYFQEIAGLISGLVHHGDSLIVSQPGLRFGCRSGSGELAKNDCKYPFCKGSLGSRCQFIDGSECRVGILVWNFAQS